MSSRTGWRTTDGQRLTLLQGALCGPFTPTLHYAARHPTPAVRRGLDGLIHVAGLNRGPMVTMRRLSAGGVPARLYTPPGLGIGAPLLVFIHGGGFVVGSSVSHAQLAKFVARQVKCKVLSVDYRMAPEHPFPAAVDDSVAAFRWAVGNAEALGVDPARIVVGGDSAGGNASVVVCLDTAGDAARPRGAWLLYPVTDTDFEAWPSHRLFAEGPLLSATCIKDMFTSYVDSAHAKDPRVAVLHADGLGALPPTYLATAGMDPLRDQGEAFADRARAAGAKVELRRFESLPHGFANLLIDPKARAAAGEACAALVRLLAA
ncbi:MAG TPA: alpha/beta hydrolase [Sporichthyaceae bacterium]|jgi:acetyl esterase|nr:alpha/beta hydrolase [Sporichthyaceae bacterium]